MNDIVFIILVTVGIELKDIKDNDLAMSNKNFTLTYDELLLLLKDAYRNGYSTYEMTAAGLEPYDDDGYARWVLLGMESNKILTSNKDKDIFFNELLNPSEPNKALKDAVAKYKMKPTAVEWLVNELSKSKYYYKIIEDINAMGTVERDVINKAKQMEEEQIMDTMYKQLQIEVNASETQKYYKSKEVQDLDNPTDVVDEYESNRSKDIYEERNGNKQNLQ